MNNRKKTKAAPSNQTMHKQRQAEMERQRRTTLFFIIGAVVLVVAIFAVLFAIAAKDTRPASSDPVTFDYSVLPRQGEESAPVKIVEFGDYKCPACAVFSTQVKPKIVSDFVDKGKASFHFVNMSFIGPDSETASLAALSVYHQNQDAFWKFADAIYANQGKEEEEWATPDFLVQLAQSLDLKIDYDLLRKDIESRTYESELQRDNNTAGTAGVSSTPTVFINGVKAEDAFNYEALSKQIEEAAGTDGAK